MEVRLNLRLILERVPDPRGRQGRDYPLWSILALIVVSLVSGRKGMKAAFELGRSLNSRQRAALGFTATTPCHATLTQTLRVIDPQALGAVLGSLRINQDEQGRHIAIDGKSMRASKDASGTSIHVVSAFCTDLQATLGHEASRGRGFELPDASLLARMDLPSMATPCSARGWSRPGSPGKAAIFSCRSRITRRNCARISNWLSTSRFFSLKSHETTNRGHGRTETRRIDVLPALAAGIGDIWPTARQICRLTRSRRRKSGGAWGETTEIVYLITSLTTRKASPEMLLELSRSHWGIEVMHRHKDFTLGEDGYTNRLDHAPRNISSILAFALRILKTVSPSPTRAIEHFQDNRNRAIRLFRPVH
ncbi:transposase family protein [Paracoccus marinaquae]|nr:transposase family protein [Paracoccus marinaquae]